MRDPTLPYLALGFGLFWSIVAAYVVRLWVAHRNLARRVEAADKNR